MNSLGGYSIDTFEAFIDVQIDGSLDVSEAIDVTFSEDRHGIFRYVPLRYEDGSGHTHHTWIDVTSVSVGDGAPVPFETWEENGNIVVKIGDPDKTITGSTTYHIRYVVENAIEFHDDGEELYWNVTGDGWDVPITNGTATVRVPEGATIDGTACYQGSYGSSDPCISYQLNDRMASFDATDTFTVGVLVSEGSLQEPTWFDKTMTYLEHRPWNVAGALLLLIPLIIWAKWGNDKKLRTIIAHYEPPEGISPAMAAVIVRGRIDKHAVAAMIVDLARRGYVQIIDGKPFKLKCIKPVDDTLDGPAAQLLMAIAGHADADGVIELKRNTGLIPQQVMASVKKGIYDSLTAAGLYNPHSFRVRDMMIGVGAVIASVSLGIQFWMGLPLAALIIFFGFHMPRWTAAGRDVAERVYGFKLFMHTAERYRSAWQEKEGIFEEYLAYAVAFKDVHRWAGVFSDLAQHPPTWYVSGRSYSALTLADSLSSFDGALASSISPPGRGGGGFSGGGGGGGGGGSW